MPVIVTHPPQVKVGTAGFSDGVVSGLSWLLGPELPELPVGRGGGAVAKGWGPTRAACAPVDPTTAAARPRATKTTAIRTIEMAERISPPPCSRI